MIGSAILKGLRAEPIEKYGRRMARLRLLETLARTAAQRNIAVGVTMKRNKARKQARIRRNM